MMDTRTGKLVELTSEQLRQAEIEWSVYQAGLLDKQPRYMPVIKDFVPAKIRRPKRKRTKATKSWRDYCN